MPCFLRHQPLRQPLLRRPGLLAALSLAAMLTAASAQDRLPGPPPMPARLVVPQARLPVQLRHVDVRTQVVGLAALTRVELEFHNPNPRVLEGELQFPLLEGQSIAGFALDIDGELRPAVPVEKARGQQVFEDVTRVRVDPGLLEATQGNNYRLRVYPLPAQGTRRVVLEIAETLPASRDANRLDWRLPLQFSGPVARLDVEVRIEGAAPLAAQLGAEVLTLARDQGSAALSFSRSNYQGTDLLQVSLPAAAPELALSYQVHRDRSYFYAEVPMPAQTAPRVPPRRLALLWDASGSGAARDHDKEFALLDRYFQALGRTHAQVQVQLLAVRDVASPVENFVVSAGQWKELRHRLETLAYDGATQLGAMQPPAGAELALLFTDGLGNYGSMALTPPDIPTFALNAATSADATLLRHVAERSGGAYLDLRSLSTDAALQRLTTAQTRLAGLRGTGAGELESASAYVQDGRIAIAGVLTQPQAEVVLDLQAPGGAHSSQVLKLKPAGQAAAPMAIAARRWATLRMATLAADPQHHRAAMRRLGQEFGLVSRETSLIVLDSVADYVRYQIEPPASLHAAWQAQMQRAAQRDAAARSRHLDEVASQFAARVAWWETDFPKGRAPVDKTRQEREEPARHVLGESAPVMAAPMPAPPQSPSAQALAAAPDLRARNEQRKGDAAGSPQAMGPSIQLRKWQPDEPYARRLRNARSEDLYAIYLDERPSYAASTAFYLDVADLLFERGQADLAARVLSNLAEMNLENRHVLRILAYRLVQARRLDQALPVLEKVLDLSPDEPQSYRDLGLALDQAQQPQRAIEQLWEVVSRPWHGRFPGIELIALGELNAIAARHPGLDLARVDARLRRNLPLDLRAVLAWDADNTDIDLWVIDPNGERAFYGHRLTWQGGQMSADFTGGYGPEEFSLRTAKPGTYTVKAQFYGHQQQIVAPATTLMLRLSSGFGTAAQKDEDVVLRLS
ncbi:MAG TPA: VIT domain-containing protein, partial [Burkholderiaceae bacterium]|nr:VIT domain-containing protein [Burkholderiaceae bacterium]